MSTPRGLVIVVVAAAVGVGVGLANGANADKPKPMLPPAQPATASVDDVMNRVIEGLPKDQPQPSTDVDPGNSAVANVHRRIGPPPDYFAQGKTMGMTDDQARAYAVEEAAAQERMEEYIRNQVLPTLPRPPG